MKMVSSVLSVVAALAVSPSTWANQEMEMYLSDIKEGQPIPMDYVYSGGGCNGKNISPAVNWVQAPSGTKSYALTMIDPDAPRGPFHHWIVYDIPLKFNALSRDFGKVSEKTRREGLEQPKNDFGFSGYGGPCPPKGDKPHRYVFTLYALKTEKIAIPAHADTKKILKAIENNSIAKSQVTAVYGR